MNLDAFSNRLNIIDFHSESLSFNNARSFSVEFGECIKFYLVEHDDHKRIGKRRKKQFPVYYYYFHLIGLTIYK